MNIAAWFFLVTTVCLGTGWLYHYLMYHQQRSFTLVVVGRALRSLNVRGTARRRAVEIIAPELAAEIISQHELS